ncbi:hypothetical protein [Amaricoccus solimangrovi]|uniref:Uncharacterized protein n=1 Tax=Amaricoccus solimangrovi TaxID=2589815 RepID=A0A501WWD2_9RHOB|nr:hypothetical protein [Amaricoccus solimangrovi]TPE51717.1 hypothetical protein FJM51_08455 [Amaricoccus solimangrovi]
MSRYVPPKQGRVGQFLDVAVLLAMTFGALYAPLYLGLAGSSKSVPAIGEATWESLGQNATQVAQYQALGLTDPAAAAPIILARYDYGFSWLALAVMFVVVIGYYVMMLRLSDREYRDVIAEKFDGSNGRTRR